MAAALSSPNRSEYRRLGMNAIADTMQSIARMARIVR
jgi:hypothetical protein